jgi:uncharacterized protein YciI/uncharacterized damage-inducible protein DinB
MKKKLSTLLAIALTATAVSVSRAQSTAAAADPQAQTLKGFYNFNKRVILASAERMPAEQYGFKPTPEVRSFAELLGHVADGNYLICSPLKGEPNPNKDEIQKTEKAVKTKDDVIKALKASFNYCDTVFENLTDATLKETFREEGKDRPKASMATLNVYHGGEHYGNIVVYLRLKGITPPSSDPAPQQQSAPKAENKPPQFDLDQYQFGLLMRGPKWTAENTPEIQKIQEGHMANINKMAQMGKLFAAGPLLDNGDLRGVFIFRAASVDEAKALAAEDPAIKAGRLKLEILPWMGSKGIGVRAMEELKKNPKMDWTMTKYHLALLRSSSKPSPAPAEDEKLQLAHLWNIRRLMDEGKILVAGPFTSGGDLRGIFVYNTESAEEAKAWAESDPYVKAGRLTAEIHPWFVAKEVWP